MDKIVILKKQLLETLLDYYIDLHNKDIEELNNVYNNYNEEMKKLNKNFLDVMIVPNSLKNSFSITDKFVVENIHLLTKIGENCYVYDKYSDNTSASYKIVYYNKTNYVTLIKL